MGAKDDEVPGEDISTPLDPPTFSPPVEMREEYLNNHKAEIDAMLADARADEWKPVMNVINHVRGTGAMYGFPAMGDAAERLAKAVESGQADSLEYMNEYARIVAATSL